MRGWVSEIYENLIKKIRQVDDVRSAEPYIMSQGLIRYGSNISPVMVRGIGRTGTLEDMAKFIVKDRDSSEKGKTARVRADRPGVLQLSCRIYSARRWR